MGAWSAHGVIKSGERYDLAWDPEYNRLDPNEKIQADHAVEVLKKALEFLDGTYGVMLSGNSGYGENEELKAFGLSISPLSVQNVTELGQELG